MGRRSTLRVFRSESNQFSVAAATEVVLHAAAKAVRKAGLTFDNGTESRLLFASNAIYQRIANGKSLTLKQAAILRTPKLRDFLTSRNVLRRLFPQQLFHLLLAEAEVEAWDTGEGRRTDGRVSSRRLEWTRYRT